MRPATAVVILILLALILVAFIFQLGPLLGGGPPVTTAAG
jgi:hypothetical protein